MKMKPKPKPLDLNGSKSAKGNYLWVGSLTLAWQKLMSKLNQEKVAVDSPYQQIQQIAHNFNTCPFNKDHLQDEQDFLIKAGFGNKSVRIINKKIEKQFPNKNIEKLQENLGNEDIILYGCFIKKLSFKYPFTKRFPMMFRGEKVPAFQATTLSQKSQILVHHYESRHNFAISFRTQNPKQQVFLFKPQGRFFIDEVMKHVHEFKAPPVPLGENDTFIMPIISLKHSSEIKIFKDLKLANSEFKEYKFAKLSETIHFEFSQTGDKGEKKVIPKLDLSTGNKKPESMDIVVDKLFWLVMRETGKVPYSVFYIINPIDQ